MPAAWSVPVACCLLGLASIGSAAQIDDSCALPQATARLHEVPTARPHEIVDGPEKARKLKERMLAAAESAGIFETASKLFDPNLNGGGVTLGLAGAGRSQQQLAVDTSHGIRLIRSSSFVEEGSNIRFELDRGCNATDSFGSNNCTLHANEQVRVRLSFRLAEPLDERATMDLNYTTRLIGLSAIVAPQILGHKKADKFRLWLPNVTASCPLCGGACEFDLYGMQVKQQMPSCPIPAGEEVSVVDQVVNLPRTDGLKLLQSRLAGSLAIRRPDGSIVAQTAAKIKIGKLDTPCNDVLSYFGKCDDFV
mmetsp:Transcript_58071/g.180424  ORF Transcript_58071/g.180424 Transcript_58071/m.180424 type:complete len:308 (+) Transcript_58071:70-993(+)